jgi:hypothetical protein
MELFIFNAIGFFDGAGAKLAVNTLIWEGVKFPLFKFMNTLAGINYILL